MLSDIICKVRRENDQLVTIYLSVSSILFIKGIEFLFSQRAGIEMWYSQKPTFPPHSLQSYNKANIRLLAINFNSTWDIESLVERKASIAQLLLCVPLLPVCWLWAITL